MQAHTLMRQELLNLNLMNLILIMAKMLILGIGYKQPFLQELACCNCASFSVMIM